MSAYYVIKLDGRYRITHRDGRVSRTGRRLFADRYPDKDAAVAVARCQWFATSSGVDDRIQVIRIRVRGLP